MENIATWPVVGSMLVTIIVSVLKVLSPGRWSVPRRRMLSRSLPFHGTVATAAGEAGAGEAPAGDAAAEAPAADVVPGVGVASVPDAASPEVMPLIVS